MNKTEYVVKYLRDGLAEYQPKMLVDEVLTDLDLATYGEQPLNLEVGAYSTWFDDPSNSIMLHYMTIDDTPVECLYRKQGSAEWLPVELFADKPFPLTSKRVRWFKLTGLEANTIYETKLVDHLQVHRFKTMPSTASDVKVALISDQLNNASNYQTEGTQAFEVIQNNDADIIVVAGDAVHDDGIKHYEWSLFWDKYFEFERRNNLMIPMIMCFGNHDGAIYDGGQSYTSLLWVSGGATEENVVFAYNFFSNITEVGYGVIDISDYLSILALNSYHTQPIAGAQTTWLSSTLSARQGRHIFPFFHVPPYPAWYPVYAYTQEMRDHWTPLFTQYGVKIVGSGHEHAHLVTKKVTGDALDPNGVVYTGQGHGAGNVTRGLGIDTNEWYVDYLSNEQKGIDLIEFKTSGDVVLNKTALNGNVLYSVTL